MRTRGSSIGIVGILAFWAAWTVFSGVSSANLPIQKKAKELGYPAVNCQYCHVEKLPKKDAMTHNERGKWLLAQKEEKGAKEVDPGWLRDYPGDKK